VENENIANFLHDAKLSPVIRDLKTVFVGFQTSRILCTVPVRSIGLIEVAGFKPLGYFHWHFFLQTMP